MRWFALTQRSDPVFRRTNIFAGCFFSGVQFRVAATWQQCSSFLNASECDRWRSNVDSFHQQDLYRHLLSLDFRHRAHQLCRVCPRIFFPFLRPRHLFSESGPLHLLLYCCNMQLLTTVITTTTTTTLCSEKTPIHVFFYISVENVWI